MVWMKVNVKGHEDRDMAVGAVLWGITGTVKGKRTLLWRSWTGKKPEGAQGLMGYGLCSTFLFSAATHTRTTRDDGTFTVCHEKHWLICSHITEMLNVHIKVNDDWVTFSRGKPRKGRMHRSYLHPPSFHHGITDITSNNKSIFICRKIN